MTIDTWAARACARVVSFRGHVGNRGFFLFSERAKVFFGKMIDDIAYEIKKKKRIECIRISIILIYSVKLLRKLVLCTLRSTLTRECHFFLKIRDEVK